MSEAYNDNKERLKELMLLLIYLTSWEEESRKEPVGFVQRAWRGYSFDLMNELESEKLIQQYTNSIIITREGIATSKGLKEKYDRLEELRQTS